MEDLKNNSQNFVDFVDNYLKKLRRRTFWDDSAYRT